MVKKIDFHIHTIATEWDSDFDYSSRWLQQYVKEANIDAIAITNHNLFDIKNYNSVLEDIPSVVVFPGIELSLEEGHVNIIVSQENVKQLEKFSKWIGHQILSKEDNLSIDDLCDNLENWEDAIYIFESGKSKSMNIPTKLSEVCAVGGVSNPLRFNARKKNMNGFIPVLFSDAHATENGTDKSRNEINFLKNKNTYLQIDSCSFKEIKECLLLRDNISLNKDNLCDVFEINNNKLSTGLNLIVGKRGTGKSVFLKEIKENTKDSDIYYIEQFETSNAEKYIENQRKLQGSDKFIQWKKKYKTQFETIRSYLREEANSNDNLSNYLKSIKQYAQDIENKNTSLIYSLSKSPLFELTETESLKKYLQHLKEIIENNDIWQIVSDNEQKKEIFIAVYGEIRNKLIADEEKKNLQKFANEIIGDVKKIVQQYTGIESVIECNFKDTIEKVQTELAINSFMKKIICNTVLDSKVIHGYTVKIELNPFENASQFQKAIGKNEAVNESLMPYYKQKEYISFLKELKLKKFYNEANLEEYILNLKVELLTEDGTEASGGQAVGFALMLRIEDAKRSELVLIDEPEASLDNEYIYTNLIPALKDLAQNIPVFVVTHNSTLGTLLKPDYLIITSKDGKDKYSIKTGEFSSKQVTNHQKGHNPIKSYEDFITAMEAGYDRYKDKGEIYENLKNP